MEVTFVDQSMKVVDDWSVVDEVTDQSEIEMIDNGMEQGSQSVKQMT